MSQTHLVQQFLQQIAQQVTPHKPSFPGSAHHAYLVSQVPYSDGPIIAGGDEDVFERVSGQTPDSSLGVSVDHGVGGGVLLSNFDDLTVFGSHQDFTLTIHIKRQDQTTSPLTESI